MQRIWATLRRRLAGQRGQTIIELLVAVGLTSILLPALLTAYITSREATVQERQRLRATGLMREANEAVRLSWTRGWSEIATNGTYRPVISGNTWDLAAGAETITPFTRDITIADGQRDANGDPVESGGTVDPSTKRVTTTVSWTQPYPASVSTTSYLSRYRSNASWSQTTQTNFNAGTRVNTVTTNTAGGEVILANGAPIPDWTNPSIIGSYNASGFEDATDVYTVGNFAYLADGTTLTIINITTPTAPTLVGTYTAAAAINHVFVLGNYAYLSTGSDTAELIVVNITTPSAPTLAGNEDLPGTADALATFVEGSFAYVGRVSSTTANSREFQILNVSNPANPTVSGGIDITGNVNNIKVSGNYAYLATTVDAQEVLVVNAIDKAAPVTAGSYNAAGTADGVDLGITGTTLYLATLVNAGGAEVFSLNIATPATPTLLDTYEVNGTVTGVSVLNGQAFLSTGITGRQLILLNATDPANLTLIVNEDLTTAANDVKAHNGYAFVASTNNTQELQVIGPGSLPGFQLTGTYESPSLDTGVNGAGFHSLRFTVTEPAGTNITFQVAANTNNTTWNFVGPDGTAATSYSAPAMVAYAAASGRYFRYRATLTSTGPNTPTLSDTLVNYSP